MTSIGWEDKFSVGIALIDEQHKMLIQRLNDLSKAIEMHRSVGEIVRVLAFLIEYTNFHFSTEEKHMTKLGYPDFDIHKQKHEEFKSTLSHMVEEFEEDGATAGLSEGVNTFLINWLVKHIKSIDSKFGKFLQQKGFET